MIYDHPDSGQMIIELVKPGRTARIIELIMSGFAERVQLSQRRFTRDAHLDHLSEKRVVLSGHPDRSRRRRRRRAFHL